jgi:hypothetical protein
MQRKVIVVLSVVLAASFGSLLAQDAPAPGAGGQRPGRGGGQFGGQRVAGEVTAVSGATLTVKTEDGGTVQVVTTDNTRVMKGNGGGTSGQPGAATVKVADLKVGDGLTAMGNLDAPNKTLHAAMIVAVDAAQIKAAKANWGKTYIAGKVTAIDMDNATMTVQRPDGSSQVTIGFDETTSFKRGRANLNMELFGAGGGAGFGGGGGGGRRPGGGGAPEAESITLADIKVGDTVAGQGTVKAGVFVPGELTVATPGQGGGRRRPNGAPGGPPPDGSATPPPGAGLS